MRKGDESEGGCEGKYRKSEANTAKQGRKEIRRRKREGK